MSRIRDVIARMATDAAFAERVRSDPDEVARQYGLTADELAKVRGLAATESGDGPSALGPRLSKSGIGTGGMVSLLASVGELQEQIPAEEQQGFSPPASVFEFNPQPEPPGDPVAADASGPAPDDDQPPPDDDQPPPDDGSPRFTYAGPPPDDSSPPPDDDLPPPDDGSPPPDDGLASEQVGLGYSDVGYYPWPNAPEDPFHTGGEEGASYAHTALGGAAAPGQEEGIVVIGGMPAAPGEEEGIIVIGSAPDPGGEEGIIIVNSTPAAAPGAEEGIIIINTLPAADASPPPDDTAPADDTSAPADDTSPPADAGGPATRGSAPGPEGAGDMIIDDGKAPTDAQGDDMIIDDGDTQAQPAPAKIVTGLTLPDSSSPLGSQDPYVTY